MLRPYLCTELNQNHVLVRRGVPYDFHMLHDIIKRGHKLHEVMAGHSSWDSQDAQHRATSNIFSQRCHFAATIQTKKSSVTLKWHIYSALVCTYISDGTYLVL